MKPVKRQKLCHNCEGEIDLDVIVCPFCAADLREEKPEQLRPPGSSVRSMNQQQSLQQSLYPPAYPKEEESEIEPLEKEREASFAPESSEESSKNIILPTILFTLGIHLLLLGFLILLFSHKGVLLLKWEGRFWFFYVLASAPCLYFGYRSLSKL